jgi:hypothetical protein
MKDDLSLESARQIDVAREDISDLRVAIAGLTIALQPARIMRASIAGGIRPSGVAARTSAERAAIIVAIAGTKLELTQIVIASGVIVGTAFAS